MEQDQVTLKVLNLEQTVERRLNTLEQQTEEILKALQKKKKASFFNKEDENKERGNWSGTLDFVLSTLGAVVGLGNIWRFPYLCYQNGGGAFFIPYCIMLVFVGMPIFVLETSLAQFCSKGCLKCWQFAPAFQGIGVGMFIISAIVSIYYNMVLAWSLYYLFGSFTDDLPWSSCRDEWSTEWCYDKIKIMTEANCINEYYRVMRNNGTCYDVTENGTKYTPVAIYNTTLASSNKIKRVLPSEEYLNRRVLGSDFSGGLDDLGTPRWELVLCYLLAYLVVALSLMKSIKSSGKVVYFTATFPYVVLIILLIRGCLLDGYLDGIEFYITPDIEKLNNARIWKDAAVQIFFSLSAAFGALQTLASYNRFHNDIIRDALTISLLNCATSVFSGFVIFSYIGYLAKYLSVPIDEVAASGVQLAFVIYSFAVTTIPAAPLWSILFFFMLFTLGVDSQFGLIETLLSSVMDNFPQTRRYKFLLSCCTCATLFLLGLTLTTDGGVYMLTVMNDYSGGWNVMLIALVESLGISYVYGVGRFLNDIEAMIGYTFCGFAPWSCLKWWWAACWCLLTPVGVAFIMGYSWYDYEGLKGEKFPLFADILGWLMSLVVLVCIIGGALYALLSTRGDLMTKLRGAFYPTVEWGPALPKHRKLVTKYVRNFNEDPWGVEQGVFGSPVDMGYQLTEEKPSEQLTKF